LRRNLIRLIADHFRQKTRVVQFKNLFIVQITPITLYETVQKSNCKMQNVNPE
jgi:hypothetical protein